MLNGYVQLIENIAGIDVDEVKSNAQTVAIAKLENIRQEVQRNEKNLHLKCAVRQLRCDADLEPPKIEVPSRFRGRYDQTRSNYLRNRLEQLANGPSEGDSTERFKSESITAASEESSYQFARGKRLHERLRAINLSETPSEFSTLTPVDMN